MITSMASRSDGELVAAAVSGDSSALAEIYDRYADAIYSFCRSRLRSEADAADAAQDTFVRAASRLEQLREPDKLRAWLYAIARNEIVSTARTASRVVGDDSMDTIAAPDSEPDIDLIRIEASAELWDAAGGLQDRDQEVLELHLRHGLVGQDLADALGVSESHANVLMSRMRDRVATSLGSLLVARQGRAECDELAMLLADWDGRFTVDVRSRVTRHTRACEICERTRGAALARGVPFGILPIVPAPSFLRAETLSAMAGARSGGGEGDASSDGGADASTGARADRGSEWRWRLDGFPEPDPTIAIPPPVPTAGAAGSVTALTRRSVPPPALAAAAAIVVIALLAATIWLFGSGDGDEVATAVAGTSVTAAPSSTVGAGTDSTSTSAGAAASSSSASSAAAGAPSTSGVLGPSTGSSSTTSSTVTTTAATAPPTTAATTAAPTTAGTTTEPATTSTVPVTTSTTSTSTSTSTSTTTSSSTTTTSTTTSTSTTTTSTTTTTEAPNEPPVLSGALVRPSQVTVDQGARCPGETALIVAEAIDPDGTIASVVARWSNGVDSFTTPMTLVGNNAYRATIGSWFVAGTQTVIVTATDDRGEQSAPAVARLTVLGCPAG